MQRDDEVYVGHKLDLSGTNYKNGDGPYAIFETRSVHHVGVIGSTGRAFSVECVELPSGKGDGQLITSFIELAPGAKLAHVGWTHSPGRNTWWRTPAAPASS